MWRASRLSFVVGPAGVGKTSLLQAGALPLVKEKRVNVLPVGHISHGAAFPWAALPSQNPYSIALLSSWSPGTPPTRLASVSVSDFIGRRAERQDTPILAVIDQAEELLADPGPRWSHRQRFIDMLWSAVEQHPQLRLLLVVRDVSGALVTSALRNGAFGSPPRHEVAPLSPGDALNAVTGPLADSGRSFSPGAADGLLTDLQTSILYYADGTERTSLSYSVEPVLLQAVCSRLWRSLPADVQIITTDSIRRYGRVSTALAAFCGHAVAAVAEEHEMTASRLRRWLLQTFVAGDGKRKEAYEGPAGIGGMSNAVIRALEDRHLLHSSPRSDDRTRWYELLSERLIGPLDDVAIGAAPASPPGSYLRAAERTLSLSDLKSADRYARLALRAASVADHRLRAEASSLLGNIAYEREKPGEAEPWYRRAAEEFGAMSDRSEVAYQLAAVGQTLIDQKNLAAARDQLLKAADRGPADPILQTGLARALWRLGEGRTAVAILDGALSIDAGNRETIGARGEILADLGQARAALRDLDRLTSPVSPSARAARGLALAQLGDHEAASADIEGAVDTAPRNGFVLFYAARAAEPGDHAAAAELARRAMEAMDPELSAHHQDQARRIYEQNQAELA
jgi:tetratricopeptide (TPR) repeat protein